MQSYIWMCKSIGMFKIDAFFEAKYWIEHSRTENITFCTNLNFDHEDFWDTGENLHFLYDILYTAFRYVWDPISNKKTLQIFFLWANVRKGGTSQYHKGEYYHCFYGFDEILRKDGTGKV